MRARTRIATEKPDARHGRIIELATGLILLL
jgi:hypothetical protein